MSTANLFAQNDRSFAEASPLMYGQPIVFVVAENPAACRTFEAAVSACGWRAEALASADELLIRPRSLGPSCLVLDVTSPGLSGVGLQERLAAERSHLPIVLVTPCGNVLMTVLPMRVESGALVTLRTGCFVRCEA